MTDLLGPASAANTVTTRPNDTRVFGVNDTWFKDCTAPNVNDGTAYEAAYFNAMLAQLRQAIRGQGVAQDNALDTMLLKSIVAASVRPGTDTGAANHLVCTLDPPILAYFEGLAISVLVAVTNTGAADINVDGKGAKSIVTADGGALVGGELKAGARVLLLYSAGSFQLANVRARSIAQNLHGIVVAQNSPQGIVTSVGNALSFGSTQFANLGASAWDGTTFTVGVGEAGLYIITTGVHFPAPAGAAYCSISSSVNNLEKAISSGPQGSNSGNAQALSCAAVVPLSEGDQVKAIAVQQSGYTIATTGSERTRMSIFLISK